MKRQTHFMTRTLNILDRNIRFDSDALCFVLCGKTIPQLSFQILDKLLQVVEIQSEVFGAKNV